MTIPVALKSNGWVFASYDSRTNTYTVESGPGVGGGGGNNRDKTSASHDVPDVLHMVQVRSSVPTSSAAAT